MRLENNQLDSFFDAYKGGQRVFKDLSFPIDGSAKELNLTGVEFEDCFLFADFQGANLSNAKFVRCNLKAVDFRNANLSGALMKNCSIESSAFIGSLTNGFRFEENYSHSNILGQSDFDEWVCNTDFD